MWIRLAQKVLVLLLTLLGASLISFSLIRLIPGDPVTNLLGERGGDPEVVRQLNERLGLDKSTPEQYWIFLKNAVTGDMGMSIVSRRPVSEEFWARFPATA